MTLSVVSLLIVVGAINILVAVAIHTLIFAEVVDVSVDVLCIAVDFNLLLHSCRR